MHCPFCTAIDTKVIDSRLAEDGSQVRRRRECILCGERFATHESPELALPRVVKQDGRRVLFDLLKLRGGVSRALEKRPVSTEVLETLLRQVVQRVRIDGEREVSTQQIGEWVMEALQEVDHVAYVRFASVYRRFEDIDAFHYIICGLKSKVNN